MILNDVEYFYVRNGQGDIIALTDSNGNEVVSYTYDSWGKLISIKDENGNDVTGDNTKVGQINPYRYRGYRYDTETGLYYLQSRYYNPEWGRFINADALVGVSNDIQSKNIFIYAYNNPINLSDPSGYHPTSTDNLWEETPEAIDIAIESMTGINISSDSTNVSSKGIGQKMLDTANEMHKEALEYESNDFEYYMGTAMVSYASYLIAPSYTFKSIKMSPVVKIFAGATVPTIARKEQFDINKEAGKIHKYYFVYVHQREAYDTILTENIYKIFKDTLDSISSTNGINNKFYIHQYRWMYPHTVY